MAFAILNIKVEDDEVEDLMEVLTDHIDRPDIHILGDRTVCAAGNMSTDIALTIAQYAPSARFKSRWEFKDRLGEFGIDDDGRPWITYFQAGEVEYLDLIGSSIWF